MTVKEVQVPLSLLRLLFDRAEDSLRFDQALLIDQHAELVSERVSLRSERKKQALRRKMKKVDSLLKSLEKLRRFYLGPRRQAR